MHSIRSYSLIALMLASVASTPEPSAQTQLSTPQLPATLTDIEGQPVDVQQLAAGHRLVVVTLKATWCSACSRQLVRLRERKEKFEACGVRFVVVSPGPRRALKAIADRTRFPYPFVEDVNLDLASALRLELAEDQIMPALILLDGERRIEWMQRGRNGAYFGDEALLRQLDCASVRTVSRTSCQVPMQ